MNNNRFVDRQPAFCKAGCFSVLKGKLNIGIILTFLILTFLYCGSIKANAVETTNNISAEDVVVCIDPGHGGENLGAEYEDYTEKEMTLIVAKAMKEELEQYEGIKVYLTRSSDEELTLQQRVDFAESVNADFFFCLHFNMSVNHDIYGAENWISAYGEQYARGMDFAQIEMKLLTDLGLYDRGIKTKLNKKGINYYGVLRASDEVNIPGVIIEHCHLDNVNDQSYYDHNEMLKSFGRLDATAVAMYYGLKSESLGKDFSTYSYEPTSVPESVVKPDTTEPEKCTFAVGEMTNGEDKVSVDVSITASDPDSRMLYYSYSLDGGLNYSDRYPWRGENDENGDTINVKIDIPYNKYINLRVRAYNLFDLMTESEYIQLEPVINENELLSEAEATDESDELNGGNNNDHYSIGIGEEDPYSEVTEIDRFSDNDKEESHTIDKTTLMIVISLIVLSLLAIILTVVSILDYKKRSKRRRKRRKR